MNQSQSYFLPGNSSLEAIRPYSHSWYFPKAHIVSLSVLQFIECFSEFFAPQGTVLNLIRTDVV